MEDRSSIWGVAATGAAGTGIGFAYTQNRAAFGAAGSSLAAFARGSTDDIIGASMQGASKAGDFSLGKMASNTSVDEQLQYTVANLPGTLSEVKTNVHMAAYESAMSSGTISSKKAIESLSPILQQDSAVDAFRMASDALPGLGGNTSIFENRIRELDVAGQYRADLLERTAVSEGGMGRSLSQNVRPEELSAAANKRFFEIERTFKRAAGDNFSVTSRSRIVENTPMGTFNVGGQKFSLPLEDTGMTYGGRDVSTRYRTRKAYGPSGDVIPFSEMYEQTMADAIEGAKYKTDLKSRVLNANQNVIDSMRERDASARAAAIWSMPEPVMPSGGRAKARLIAQEAVGYGVDETDILDLVGSQKIYAQTSSGAAGKGTMMTSDVSEDIFGSLGNLISAEQQPMQFIRSEWGATSASKRAGSPFAKTFGQAYNRVDRKIQGKGYQNLLYGGKGALSGQAYSAPQLMTFYAKPAQEGFGLGYDRAALNQLLPAEEGVIAKSAQDMMEYERVVQKKISLEAGMTVDKDILSQLKGKRRGEFVQFNKPIEEARLLGIEAGTGKQVMTAAEDRGLRQAAIGAELTGINEATIYMRERRRLKDNELWKFFSEENKFMMGVRDKASFREVAQAAGLDKLNVGGQNIESIISGKLVGRNKMALITQQIEATSMFLAARSDSGGMGISKEAAAFLADPAKALNVSGILNSGTANADAQIQRNLIGLAKRHRFNKEEMGMTFGLLNSVDPFRDILTTRDISAIKESPGVVGLGKGRLGNLASGKWGRGSFEQSGFRLLAMKGGEGSAFAGELSKRILGKGNLDAVDRMAASVLGQEPLFDKFNRGSVADFSNAKNLIQEEGRYLDLGRKFDKLGGSRSLYIPGTTEAGSLMSPIQSGGKMIDSPLASELKSFQGLIRGIGVADEELEMGAAKLRNVAMTEVESQFGARGKIVGSEIMTGMRRSFKEGADTFRISGQSATRMFDDLINRASTSSQKDFLSKEKAAALAQKTMYGGMWRHPTTGPESFQFVKYKVDTELAEGMIAAPTKLGKIQFEGMGKALGADISEMVGFAGDFDRDQFVLSAISERDTASRVEKSIGGAIKSNYNDYVFNHYGMKNLIEGQISKSDVLNMKSAEGLQAGYRKLTTAKTTTGQVNVALQRLKMGLQYSAPEKYQPLASMFFHLEQATIGGKHGVAQSDLYQAIAGATEGGKGSVDMMEQAMTGLFGSSEINLKGSLTGSSGDVSQHAFKMNTREAAEIAISSYESVSEDVEVAMRSVATGRGKQPDAELAQLVEQFHKRRAGGVDVSQAFMQGQISGDKFTQRGTRALRKGQTKVRGFLNVVKKAKKPLLLGAAAAAGVMLMAPSTAGSIRATRTTTGGGKNFTPEDLGPPSGVGLNPPSPGQNISPRVYDTGGARQTSRASIRMRLNDLESNSGDFMGSVRSLGGKVRMQTSDDRSALDSRMLASKIHERL